MGWTHGLDIWAGHMGYKRSAHRGVVARVSPPGILHLDPFGDFCGRSH